MKKLFRKSAKVPAMAIFAAGLVLFVGLGSASVARADEADAKRLVKAMSDYMAAQQAISFAYDSNLEVVTKDHQKLALMSSGTVTLKRPGKIHATRTGGFADVELLFDGKTMTFLGKNANLYAQIDIPGTSDHLIDELQDKYNVPLPAADLLMMNAYDQLMPGVVDVKDLGSGVIGGIECDHLAFRTEDVDWQIWIAHGDRPYPCQYVITSKLITNGPQYSIQIRDWKTGKGAAVSDFNFKNLTAAKKIALKDIPEMDELPKLFTKGDAK